LPRHFQRRQNHKPKPGPQFSAALRALAADGFTAVKADVLARTLGVSRGSFYWHFENIDKFHLCVMQRWQDGRDYRASRGQLERYWPSPFFTERHPEGVMLENLIDQLVLLAFRESALPNFEIDDDGTELGPRAGQSSFR